MFRSVSCFLAAIFLAFPVIAQERSYVYSERWKRANTLVAVCARPNGQDASGVAVSRESITTMAKELGFSQGVCRPPTRENFGDMAVLVFTLGIAVLYLTPDELATFLVTAEETGRMEPINTSPTWPPNS